MKTPKFYRYIFCTAVIAIAGNITGSMEVWAASMITLSLAIGNWSE